MTKGISVLFEYETPKMVQISNIKVGVAHKIIQLIILIYIIGYILVYDDGYQEIDVGTFAITTKMKGVGFTEYPEIPGIGTRSWDTVDYIKPPIENNALFVATNIIMTLKQQLSRCPEPGSFCKRDSDCDKVNIIHYKSGKKTGKCIIPASKTSGLCEIYSWCPLENDTLPLGKKTFMFPMVENYTLLIKNDVDFASFGVKRRNIQPWVTKKFIRKCTYVKDNPEMKFCPIFKLGDIFKEAKVDQNLFVKGGVIGINIQWDCDLDWPVQYCNPAYTFTRLDDESVKSASGFNFRYANYYRQGDTLYRDLIKAHGIRFIFNVKATAKKFSIVSCTLNIGAGIALLGLAPTFCDVIALNLLRSRNIYQKAKYETIEEEKLEVAVRKAVRAERVRIKKVSDVPVETENIVTQTLRERLMAVRANAQVKRDGSTDIVS